jgi:hypothetical protein
MDNNLVIKKIGKESKMAEDYKFLNQFEFSEADKTNFAVSSNDS